MRVVLDTNILVSAFIFPGGAPEAVYRAALEGRIEPVTSPALLAELGRVLTDKFGWEPGFAEQAVAQVTRIADVVRPRERLAVIREDPDDDRVLEAAITGHAEAIVSGDGHLVRLAEWHGIAILTAPDLLERLPGD